MMSPSPASFPVFYSDFQDFTAKIKLVQRQIAVLVEFFFFPADILVRFSSSWSCLKTAIHQVCTSWRQGFRRVFWREMKPVAPPELLKSKSEQRFWTFLWCNSPFCGNLSSQSVHWAPRTDHSMREGQKHITENRMLNLKFVLLLVPSHKLLSFFFRCFP